MEQRVDIFVGSTEAYVRYLESELLKCRETVAEFSHEAVGLSNFRENISRDI